MKTSKSTKAQVIETNTKTVYTLILRKRGRLILKSLNNEAVVLGFGSTSETMLDDLNNSVISKKHNLKFKKL